MVIKVLQLVRVPNIVDCAHKQLGDNDNNIIMLGRDISFKDGSYFIFGTLRYDHYLNRATCTSNLWC